MKFFALIVYTNHTIKKVWASNDDVKTLLKNPSVETIYRTSNDQIAKLNFDLDEVSWIDMTESREF